MLQQPRGIGSFSEGVLCLKDQEPDREVTSPCTYRSYFLRLLLIFIYGSLPALAMLQQPRGSGSFSKGVLCLKDQEMTER